jgi:hypothetical protein
MAAVRKWAYIFSPCVIISLLSLLGIIISLFYLKQTRGYSMMLIMILLPASIVAYIVDKIIKYFINKVGWLWICQIAIVFAVLSYWYW